MTPETHSFVPKVHPATRAVEPDDPMTLHAAMVEGDPEVMLQCVVQEYAWMGWDTDKILTLFRDPFYPALHQLLRVYGETGIRERIGSLLGQMGVFRIEAVVSEEPEAIESEPDLIQLGILSRGPKKGTGPLESQVPSPFSGARGARADYYLAVSALSPYKRLDLAVAACNRLRRPLLVVGAGPEEKRLRAQAGPTVRFLGWQPNEVIRDHLRRCRALLFPGEEDFGLVPLEANACATPVIAFGRGGATESIIPPGRGREPTGLWFAEQTADCLAEAVLAFERRAADFDPAAMRRQALRFNQRRFADELFAYLDGVLRSASLRVQPRGSRWAA
jgi:glycosyltransferase involved in cell wall biosynthesis